MAKKRKKFSKQNGFAAKRRKIQETTRIFTQFLLDYYGEDSELIQHSWLELDLLRNQDENNRDEQIKLCWLEFVESDCSEEFPVDSESECYLLVTSKKDFFLVIIENDEIKFSTNLKLTNNNNEKHHFSLIKILGSNFRKSLLNVESFLRRESKQICLDLKVYLYRKAIFTDYQRFNELSLSKNEIILTLMAFLYDYPVFQTKPVQDNLCLEEFYSLLYLHKKKMENSNTTVIPNLIPKLRKYQEYALNWMINRETNVDYHRHEDYFVKHTLNGAELYYHKLLGHFVTREVYDRLRGELKITFGGILADEMGLGKTIEMLALILSNRKRKIQSFNSLAEEDLFPLSLDPVQGCVQCFCGDNNISIIESVPLETIAKQYLEHKFYLNQDLLKCPLCGNYQHLDCVNYQVHEEDFPYICSKCWPSIEPVDSGCTLIVTPSSILQQWIDEIHKHTQHLKVYRYHGVQSREYIFPPNLAKYDIVITDYSVLRSELNFSSVRDYQHLRKNKRYHAPVTPLKSINWWRVCFDEAQMVESAYSRVAMMANSLTSTYRWAVTGTPIQRSVHDLFGLLSFIHEEPYCHEPIWNNALYFPYCNGNPNPIVNALSSCFWRTPKNSVLDEIGIAEPIVQTYKLDFSQIERDFYHRQSRICQFSIDEKLKNVDPDCKLKDLCHSTQTTILSLALKLRQCCCHPQLCIKSDSSLNQYCSLQDVLTAMIEDAKYECEREHRIIVASLNGSAAYYAQFNQLKDSIVAYESALKSVKGHEPFFRTDKTQLYHIYYNLAQIMEFYGIQQLAKDGTRLEPFNGEQPFENCVDCGDPPEVNNENQYYRLEAKEIYNKYLFKDHLASITTDKYRVEQSNKCFEIQKQIKMEKKWFIYAINVLDNCGEIESILASFVDSQQFFQQNNLTALKMILVDHLEDIEGCRESILDTFEYLNNKILEKREIGEFIYCHVKKLSEKKCSLCSMLEIEFKRFEKLMFDVKRKNKENSLNKEQNWNENKYILLLRRIGQIFKAKAVAASDYKEVVNEINIFMDYLDEIQKEFKVNRKCHTGLWEFVLRIDEMDQAQSRHVVDSNEPDPQYLLAMDSEKFTAECKLKVHLSRLKYLSNLQNSLKDRNEVEVRICSICWSDLTNYFVIPCGHFYCFTCMIELKKHCPGKIRCSVCRSEFTSDSLACIDSSSPVANNRSIVGSWSTKILVIIRRIISIVEADEKILVFSTWTNMLGVMKSALEKNKILTFQISGSSGNFVHNIRQFQEAPRGCVLLIQTAFASRGLNLVEASHVVFINSSLNKTDELQAIGRIYRIGQTRQTYVHKFIIKDTIEELIENHNDTVHRKSLNRNSEFNNLSVAQFCQLFYH